MLESRDAAKREAPWMAGLHAARANLLPGLILQGIMLGLLIAYYFYPPTTRWLNLLAALKGEWGYAYSAIASVIAGALIPETMRVLVLQKGRALRANAANLVFTIPFWCMMGLIVDAFYRGQALVFGAQPSFRVVAAKALVDQLLYAPFVSVPLTCWLYDWKNSGYRLHGLRRFFSAAYCRDVMVPVLFANWSVWIPVVCILYSLPSLLQIPLFALAVSLWVIIYTWISEQRTPARSPLP
ncbi:hypothetical protein HZ994_12410 [Akkermansiaceae bacterium]|nr:hypothetical protein HZ994_12410 [Akkermansiaceae bacterium]